MNLHVRLESPVSTSYRCKRAADALDIDVSKKSVHEFSVNADFETPWQIGVILGASGSGKTTLAKKVWGTDCFETKIDSSKPIIEQFPESFSYDQCAELLNGIGLSAVPCWIKPVYTLSNGQRARAEAALMLSEDSTSVRVIDEWTSVVDRTVAKSMSHCASKMIRRSKRQLVLLSCHYDVVEWLDPDWIIDCNTQSYIDRRLLPERSKREKLEFQIRRIGRDSWRFFSKYHYLSDKLPGGSLDLFGLFERDVQIGFLCFARYKPEVKNEFPIFHFNRLVIHPDYCGLGLGIKFLNACTAIVKKDRMCEVRGKFSSTPTFRALSKDKANWRLINTERKIGIQSNKCGASMIGRMHSMRHSLTTYTFKYVGKF